VYSADEVELIRKEAFAAGKLEAASESAHIQALSLTAVSQSVGTLIQQFDATISALRIDSAQLALAVGKKLADAALATVPGEELVGFISDCMHKLHLEPRLVIRVSPDTAEYVKSQIEPLGDRNGFSGRVIVLVEPSLSSASCRIEWADGGVELDPTATYESIQHQVNRWHSARTSQESES
jgi:flagellar assembly protein FliH